MKDIMVDLETLGTAPGSAIVSIGAVYFDLRTRELGDRFYCIVDLRRGPKLSVDMDTLCWWMQQSDKARDVFLDKVNAVALHEALADFTTFVDGGADEHGPAGLSANRSIWGNGANFDNVLLECAYRECGIPVPWPFYMDRCYRTMKAFYKEQLGIDPPLVREGTFHNALDDAVTQARHLIKIVELAPDGNSARS